MPSNSAGERASRLHEGCLDLVRRLGDVDGLLAEPQLEQRVAAALLARPSFALLYQQRRTRAQAWVGDRARSAASGLLSAEVRAFQAHYGLLPKFFPVARVVDAGPIEFAAWLLARDHDVYHVLCEYETSDHDEVALQSFLCGQVPCVFARFVTMLKESQRVEIGRFKHLRDVLDAPIDRAGLARGQRARPLVVYDYASQALRPVPALRRELAIEARGARASLAELRNSCGGKSAPPYFGGAGEIAD